MDETQNCHISKYDLFLIVLKLLLLLLWYYVQILIRDSTENSYVKFDIGVVLSLLAMRQCNKIEVVTWNTVEEDCQLYLLHVAFRLTLSY